MDIQAFVAEFAVETLQVAVLHGFTWVDEIEGNVVFIGPDIERLPGKLRAIIQRDSLGRAVPKDELIQQALDALMVDPPELAPEQQIEASLAPARSFCRQPSQALTHPCFIGADTSLVAW